jgi:glycosyltransferase involved in cell wall biosynthesis
MNILYIAPWIDIGGSDTATLDWCRFTPATKSNKYLVTTQPSANRRIHEARPFVQEAWDLPSLMAGSAMPQFLLDFVTTRSIDVIHIMNSQLGLEMIPDFTRLSPQPQIVVQFHVEEEKRDGYVGHFATRYGNLVDLFMVSTSSLQRVMTNDYSIPSNKIVVVRTGVPLPDPRPSYSTSDESDPFHILWVGRLVDQKDPVEAIRVSRELVDRGINFALKMVGDGPLLEDVRKAVIDFGVDSEVELVGELLNLTPEFNWCDLLLMTSRFEGIPIVSLNAMAHCRPVVGPNLPTLREVLSGGAGILAESCASSYAEAISAYDKDRLRLEADGRTGRQLAEAEFSLEASGRATFDAYEELTEPATRNGELTPLKRRDDWQPLPTRSPNEEPLVSVVIACFNHAAFLAQSIRSALDQDYPNLEVIVVNDGSTDPAVADVLDVFEHNERVHVETQSNRGPGSARNRAVEWARGRFILPLDADNELRPRAVRSLVRQLQHAPLDTAFVYPRIQYFDGRDENFVPPAWNAHGLIRGNYCDTGSLIDAAVFSRGHRYLEEPRGIHEDWEFFAELVASGYVGCRSDETVLNYRKTGFTRSDLIDVLHKHDPPTAEGLRSLGAEASLRARTSPAISIIDIDPDVHRDLGPAELNRFLEDQTSQDFEYLYIGDCAPKALTSDSRYRRIPNDKREATLDLGPALLAAKSPLVLIFRSADVNPLIRRTLVEETIRTMGSRVRTVMWQSGGSQEPVGIVVRRNSVKTALTQTAQAARTLLELATWCSAFDPNHTVIELPELQRHPTTLPRELTARKEYEPLDARRVLDWNPLLSDGRAVGRSGSVDVKNWMPHAHRALMRTKSDEGNYVVSPARSTDAAQGVCLGLVPIHSPHGTVRLVFDTQAGHYFTMRPADRINLDETRFVVVCSLETSPLPLYTPLFRCTTKTPLGEQETLVGSRDTDPLHADVQRVEFLGFVLQAPLQPHVPETKTLTATSQYLLRKTDNSARRHCYSTGTADSENDQRKVTIFSLAAIPNALPLQRDANGIVFTDTPNEWHRSSMHLPRWISAPVTWRDMHLGVQPRLRAVARRAISLLRSPRAIPPAEPFETLGWISNVPRADLERLYSFRHPVTGDQLITHSAQYAKDLGYADGKIIGYSRPPKYSHPPEVVRWGSRFGLMSREVVNELE